MKIFSTFVEAAPNRVFFAIVLGALAGISYSLLIPLMLNVLTPPDARFSEPASEPVRWFLFEVANPQFAHVFLGMCVFILLARTVSQIVLARVAMTVAVNLRTRLYHRIADAPIIALDRIGPSKLIAVLTTDVPRIVAGARMLPDLLINGVTLIGMLGFLFFLNPTVFWFVMGCILVGTVTYQIPMFIGRRFFIRSRHHIDGLQEAIRGLIYGAKELKLDRIKRDAYFRDVLLRLESRILHSDKWGQTIVRLATNYGNMLSFFVIGAVTFVLVNYQAISNTELIGVIMALLYVTAPIAALLNFIPQLAIAQVSINKVQRLLQSIPVEDAGPGAVGDSGEWQNLALRDVRFSYPDNGEDRGFQLGPVDLEIARGQVTFIVGGNGSGKSTLSKILAMHYLPDSGDIVFDDAPVTPQSLAGRRQQIGAIFSDYYLFEQLLGQDSDAQWSEVDRYLEAFDLKKRLRFENGKFSTLRLSDGQRRRLALLVAMLDDKQLYLFDEWAADQDPTFKSVFYYEILPLLKRRGKAVIVISHDERFFDVADQLIEIEEGQIRRIELRDDCSETPRDGEYLEEASPC